MIEYKKLKIKDEEDIEKLDLDDIEPLMSFADVHFLNYSEYANNAIVFSFGDNKLKYKVAKLNSGVDWIIRKYDKKLYLIGIKKRSNVNMTKYRKLKIKSEEELDINDIEPLSSFEDIHFRKTIDFRSAISYAYDDNELKYKVAKLSKSADWIIREYEGELYLIVLKKDC